MNKLSVIAILIIVVLSSCGSPAPESTSAPTTAPTRAPTATVEPEPVELTLTILNNSTATLDYFYVNPDGNEELYATLAPGDSVEQPTYFEDVWRVRNQDENLVLEYTVTEDAQQSLTIDPEVVAAADPLAAELEAQVQKFKDEGHIPTTEGEYIRLGDFNESFSQLGFYQAYPLGIELENFVFSGHLKWSTATQTSDVSACGVLFAGQPDNADYAVFLDKSRVYFSSSTAKFYKELGKTRGTGRVDFGNPAEADFSLVVYQSQAYVYVDDAFIGEYTLSQDKPLRGSFGYGIISGTNKDYGTRCEITQAAVWSLK